MLDALKGLLGGGKARKQADDLEALLRKSHEERSALSALLNQIGARSQALTQTDRMLADVSGQASEAAAALEAVATRLDDLQRQTVACRGELEQLQGVSGQLTQDYAKAREISREADDDAFAALEAVKDIEKRLKRLGQLQEMNRAADEKLAALRSLTEQVAQKSRILENEQDVLDRAAARITQAGELVAKMDAQIGTLNEGLTQLARGDDMIARLDASAADTRTTLETAERSRDEFAVETARIEKHGRDVIEFMRESLERMALDKHQVEVLEQRLGVLEETVQSAETRLEALGVRERQLAYLPKRFEEFSDQFEALATQAEDLARRQASLETLRERLGQVEDISARATSTFESLSQSHTDLETLRAEIHAFHESYAQAVQLRDRLGADRTAIEGFAERVASFRARIPELEAAMAAVLDNVGLVEEGSRRAVRIGEIAADLDAKLTRVTARAQVVETLEGRLNGLHMLSAEVDAKLAQQLARRLELDTLKSEVEGVIVQMVDAQHKLDGVGALQNRLLPMEARLAALQDNVEKTGARMSEVQRQTTSIAQQEERLAELVEASQTLAVDVTARMQQVEMLADTLAQAGPYKDELIDELARVHARQREALRRAEATNEQLRRAETMYGSLEQRRSQLVFSEKKLAAVETRMAELGRMAAEIDARMSALTERDGVVTAIRSEIEHVRQISARSREDLQYMSAHRAEISALRQQFEALLAQAGDFERKIGEIQARRRDADETHAKAANPPGPSLAIGRQQ